MRATWRARFAAASSSWDSGLDGPISASTPAGEAYVRRRSGSGGPETSTVPGISHAG